MKITKDYLKRLIKEEIGAVNNKGVDPTCPDDVVEHAEDILLLLTPFDGDAGPVEWSEELEADFLEKFEAFIEEYKEKASEAAAAARKAVEDSREDF